MSTNEEKKEQSGKELTGEELEKFSAGSWLGNIWNKIKSFGGGSGCTDCIDNQ